MVRRNAARRDSVHVSGYHTLLGAASYYSQVVGISETCVGITKDQVEAIPNALALLKKYSEVVMLLNPELGDFKISAPLAVIDKSQIVKLGASLNVPFELTWSCLDSQSEHCGICEQCKIRRQAFIDADIADPTVYLG